MILLVRCGLEWTWPFLRYMPAPASALFTMLLEVGYVSFLQVCVAQEVTYTSESIMLKGVGFWLCCGIQEWWTGQPGAVGKISCQHRSCDLVNGVLISKNIFPLLRACRPPYPLHPVVNIHKISWVRYRCSLIRPCCLNKMSQHPVWCQSRLQ